MPSSSFPLSTGTDVATDGLGQDLTLIAAAGTITAGDNIDARDGNDTLQATLADTEVTGAATFTNFEAINLTVAAGARTTFTASGVQAGAVIHALGAGAHVVQGASVNVDASGLTGAGTLEVTFTGADVIGTGGANDDVFRFGTTLNNQDSINGGAGNDTVTATIDGLDATTGALRLTNVEAVTLTSANSASTVDLTGAGALLTLTLSGDQAVTVGGISATATTIDASAATGAVTLSKTATTAATITTGAGDDSITTAASNDTITGGLGADALTNGAGSAQLGGGDGNDTLDGGTGQDTLIGGAGADSLSGGDGNDVFLYAVADAGSTDVITDFAAGDVIRVATRNFTGGTVTSGTGASVAANSIQVGAYSGGKTRLHIDTEGDADTAELTIDLAGNFTGGTFSLSGTDITYAATTAPTTMTDGGSGDGGQPAETHSFALPAGGGSVTATDGDDTVTGSSAADTIQAGGGNDVVTASGGNDSVRAGNGADVVYGNAGADLLFGNAGADSLFGGRDDDTVYGGRDHDTVSGDLGNDTLYGDLGDDLLLAGDGGDQAAGGDGGDRLYGNQGSDVLFGNAGADTLHGGRDNDSVYGGRDNDAVFGDLGDDWLFGNLGDDALTGGDGADTFVFQVNGGHDTVADFSYAQGDRIAVASGLTRMVGSNGAGDAVITFSDGSSTTLLGVQASQVTENWFLAA